MIFCPLLAASRFLFPTASRNSNTLLNTAALLLCTSLPEFANSLALAVPQQTPVMDPTAFLLAFDFHPVHPCHSHNARPPLMPHALRDRAFRSLPPMVPRSSPMASSRTLATSTWAWSLLRRGPHAHNEVQQSHIPHPQELFLQRMESMTADSETFVIRIITKFFLLAAPHSVPLLRLHLRGPGHAAPQPTAVMPPRSA